MSSKQHGKLHNAYHSIKITRQAKKQENTSNKESVNQKKLELADKDIKNCYNFIPYTQNFK